ncbi:MAG: redoxin domain-containing protein [Rhodothermaceae bacterium]
MKKYLSILVALLLIVACAKQEPLPENYKEVIGKYYQTAKYDSALILINRLLVEKKDLTEQETKMFTSYKMSLLIQLKKYEEALPIAIEIEAKSERKSPYRVEPIAQCYLGLGKMDEAVKAVNKMVDLGFKNLAYFDEEPYTKLKKLDVYSEIEQKIKDNIGLDKPAKDFTLTDLNGKEFTLSKMKGKVVLVDFWATWCGPCRREIPNLVKYYDELNKKGFEILGVSLDPENKLEDLKKFIEKEKMNWPVFYSSKGWADPTSRMYGVNSIPSTWLIDKKGVLRYFSLHGEEVKTKVEELLAEK